MNPTREELLFALALTKPVSERAAWLKLSEQSLMKAWGNQDDDVFNELLAK